MAGVEQTQKQHAPANGVATGTQIASSEIKGSQSTALETAANKAEFLTQMNLALKGISKETLKSLSADALMVSHPKEKFSLNFGNIT